MNPLCDTCMGCRCGEPDCDDYTHCRCSCPGGVECSHDVKPTATCDGAGPPKCPECMCWAKGLIGTVGPVVVRCDACGYRSGRVADQDNPDLKICACRGGSALLECCDQEQDPTDPPHYHGSIEPFDIYAALGILEAACQANCLKYLYRYRAKNGIEDLRKCRVYLDKLIQCVEARDAR